MTPPGMVALRLAATVVHALPGLRARLRDGQRTLLQVARPPVPAGPVIGPCAFRMAVARAHERYRSGERLAFLDLPEGCDPAIDIGVPSGGAVLPGGIYRVPVEEGLVHACATALPARACRELVEGITPSFDGVVAPIRLTPDLATEVTLLHAQGPADAAGAARVALEELLVAMVAEEVAAGLALAAR